MNIQEINKKEHWHPDTSEFLQSWEWGEFQRVAGNRPVRLVVDGSCVQGFEHRLPMGLRYTYFPRPVTSNLEPVTSFLRQHGNIFVRVEPENTLDQDLVTRYSLLATSCRQPQHTLILDLTKSEETLLSEMHKKTRYNIRLAEKKGVEIRDGKDIDWFWDLNQETTARDGFKSHDKEYYKKMLEMPIVHQLTAFFDGKPIASQMYIGYGGTCTYLHGASSNEYRNVMAPYLLQWRSIQFAKKFGNTAYDFWGVAAPVEGRKTFHTYSWDDSDKLSNVTRYKAGFGGTRKSYPDAFEVPLKNMQYKLFQLAKKVL